MMALVTPSSFRKRCHNKKFGAKYFHYFHKDPLTVLGFQSVKVLGVGMSGEVHLARHKIYDEKEIAVKIFSFKNEKKLGRSKKLFVNETGILQDLQHDNIATFCRSLSGPTYAVITLNYIPDGPLGKHLKDLSSSDAGLYFIHIGSAVRYMHSKHIIHRDIKPSNILIDKNLNQAYLTDFGLSRRLPDDDAMLKRPKGTVVYSPPEMFTSKSYDGYKADAFSLGACLWSMLMRAAPDINTKYFNELEDKQLDPVLLDCARGLLWHDPKDRWDITALLQDLNKRGHYSALIVKLV